MSKDDSVIDNARRKDVPSAKKWQLFEVIPNRRISCLPRCRSSDPLCIGVAALGESWSTFLWLVAVFVFHDLTTAYSAQSAESSSDSTVPIPN